MPEFTKAMQFVLLRSQAEAKAAHQEEATVEFLFLGLLKLAEVRAADFVNTSSSDSLKAVDDEIKTVRGLVAVRLWPTRWPRRMMWKKSSAL